MVENSRQDENFSIQLDQVGKIFSTDPKIPPALFNISAQIKKGTLTGIVGADGSGKTTLLRIIANLLSLSEGKITIEGFDPEKESSNLRSMIGYMPQKFGLYDELSVIENLTLYADLRSVPQEERTQIFIHLLHFTALSPFIHRRAGYLSGGMKQKLGLACALLGKPKILLLDEPSVGVDPISRRELWKMVGALLEEGMTILWSTSYLYEAEECEEVLILEKGQLIYSGSPQVLTERMKGRSIQIQNAEKNHRLLLQKALSCDEIMDGIIQGKNIRLVLKEKGKFPALDTLTSEADARMVTVPPRFEDAYIDLLGGLKKEFLSASFFNLKKDETEKNELAIEAHALTKKFDSFIATNQISFSVKKGEIFCLLGPNGAGKSTTYKMLCGLLTPTSGSAKILGIDLQKNPAQARQKLGYMAQKFSLYGDLTLEQNLTFYSGLYGLSGEAQKEKMSEMIDIFELQPYLAIKSHHLPLGFKQRLALACAIMHNPAILFLDEPTSGVDPIARREFWTHINRLVEQGMTVIVTTHFMDEAEYCDHIALIYKGKLIATGTPEELKNQVRNSQQTDPSMEEAFIELIKQQDKTELLENVPNKENLQHNLPVLKIKTGGFNNQNGLTRFIALFKKEFYQIIRDPSSILVAFILPMLLLFIFGFGINLDTSKIRLGIVLHDSSSDARRFEQSYHYSPFIEAITLNSFKDAEYLLTKGKIRGIIIIQSDFSIKLKQKNKTAPIQVITDGAEPNTANFVIGYATGAWQNWLSQRANESAKPIMNLINLEPRYWYNPATISRFFLVPGSIVLIMTVIGALLTSLVIAREWERGTMEALLLTPITRIEFLASKWIPYYLLGMMAMFVCTVIAIIVLGTPFRGSFFLLFIESSLFLGSVLGLGLFLSAALRNQFTAAQAALNIAYLPAMMLSGFVFEISSMPIIIQAITYILPARYFVSCLQTLFLTGNIGSVLLKNGLFLFVATGLFLFLAFRVIRQKLD